MALTFVVTLNFVVAFTFIAGVALTFVVAFSYVAGVALTFIVALTFVVARVVHRSSTFSPESTLYQI